MEEKIEPLFDRVLVKTEESTSVTKSGIIIPDTAKEKPQRGTIVSVGNGKTDEPMTVKVGDKVIYSQSAGVEVKFGAETFLIMRESEIFAIIGEKRNE